MKNTTCFIRPRECCRASLLHGRRNSSVPALLGMQQAPIRQYLAHPPGIRLSSATSMSGLEICQQSTSRNRRPESESAEPAEAAIAPGGSLLDGRGEIAYSPFPERREPLMKPVELPQGTLEMLILKAISLGPLHGYGILLRIQQISGERLEILQGSFYTAIYRLERRGWIKGEWGESENNRRARFYLLTAAGTRQLKAETAKWTDMAAVVAGILDKKADEI